MSTNAANDLFKNVDESDSLRKKAIKAVMIQRDRVKNMRQEIIRVNPKTIIIKYHAQ